MIRSLVPAGAAEQDGRLHPGHRLMSVNNTNLEHATLDTAVQTLKSTERGTGTYLFICYVHIYLFFSTYLLTRLLFTGTFFTSFSSLLIAQVIGPNL